MRHRGVVDLDRVLDRRDDRRRRFVSPPGLGLRAAVASLLEPPPPSPALASGPDMGRGAGASSGASSTTTAATLSTAASVALGSMSPCFLSIASLAG